MCLNAQLQLSRPKYLRARLLKGDEIFVFPKNPHFLIPVLSKNIVKLYREGSTPPPPSTVEKKMLKRFKRKVERNDITYTQKINLFDEKNNGTVFNQKRKKNHL